MFIEESKKLYGVKEKSVYNWKYKWKVGVVGIPFRGRERVLLEVG